MRSPTATADYVPGQAETFTDREEEFRAGDRVLFTRNNYRAKQLNGQVATVMAVDSQGSSLWLATQDGKRQMFYLTHLGDRHVRPGWVRTVQSAQGATAERVIAHLEAFRANRRCRRRLCCDQLSQVPRRYLYRRPISPHRGAGYPRRRTDRRDRRA